MDHNAYAVALGDITSANQTFTATYHLYIGDADGTPMAGFGDASTTWTWKGPAVAPVPEPSPTGLLAVGGLLALIGKNRVLRGRRKAATTQVFEKSTSGF